MLLLAAALGGCAISPPQPTTLDLPLVMQDAQGRESGRGSFTAYNDGQGPAVELLASPPDGERFQGRLIQDSTVSQEWRPSLYQPPRWYRGRYYYPEDDFYSLQPVTRYSGKGEALLTGDKGRTMKCSFTFAAPGRSIFGGGFGDCQLSDGSKAVIPQTP